MQVQSRPMARRVEAFERGSAGSTTTAAAIEMSTAPIPCRRLTRIYWVGSGGAAGKRTALSR